MEKDKLELLVKMLKLTIKCGRSANIELDKATCEYLLEIIRKDIIENDIPISFNILT